MSVRTSNRTILSPILFSATIGLVVLWIGMSTYSVWWRVNAVELPPWPEANSVHSLFSRVFLAPGFVVYSYDRFVLALIGLIVLLWLGIACRKSEQHRKQRRADVEAERYARIVREDNDEDDDC